LTSTSTGLNRPVSRSAEIVFNLGSGVRFVDLLLYPRTQGLDRDYGIGDQICCRDILAFIGDLVT
jgi:hypothetical protein